MVPNLLDEGKDQPRSDSTHPLGNRDNMGEQINDDIFGDPLLRKQANILCNGFQNVGGVSSGRNKIKDDILRCGIGK